MKAKAKKITLGACAAVLAALVIIVAVFCFVKNDDGFNTGATPFQISVAKNGVYSRTYGTGASQDTLNEDHAEFEKFVKDYYAMTSFNVMRGIVEGKWFPKAKLEEVIDANELESVSAAEGYLITLYYNTDQNAEVKVKKGTKDNPNVIKIGYDEYTAGEKVAFKFTSVVLAVTDSNFIESLTLYAFDKTALVENDPEFAAYKITVQANQISLFEACKALLS